MKRNRRTFFCCLAAACLLAMTACGNSQSSDEGNVTAPGGDSAAAATPEGAAPDQTAAGQESSSADSSAADGTTGAGQSALPAADSTASGETPQTTAATSGTQANASTAPGTDTGSGRALYGDNITAAPGAKHVPVTVSIRNNPGISFMGIRMIYDPALSPVMTEGLLTEYLDGTVTKGTMSTCAANVQKQFLGYSAMSTVNLTADGTLFTCYFDLPDNAKPGTRYEFRLEGKSITNIEGTAFHLDHVPFTITVQ